MIIQFLEDVLEASGISFKLIIALVLLGLFIAGIILGVFYLVQLIVGDYRG